MTTCNPPAPGCVQLEMIFKLNAQTIENVFHLRKGDLSAPTHAEMTTLAHQAAQNWLLGPWKECGTQLIFSKAQCRDISPGPGGDVVVDVTNTGATAPVGGTALPNNVALAIAFHTALGGRSGRGRIYLGGLTSSLVSTINGISGGAATNLAAEMNAWFAAVIAGTTYQFGVLSKWHNKVCRAEAVFTQIASVSVDLTTDSQRRRLPGRGN